MNGLIFGPEDRILRSREKDKFSHMLFIGELSKANGIENLKIMGCEAGSQENETKINSELNITQNGM